MYFGLWIIVNVYDSKVMVYNIVKSVIFVNFDVVLIFN